MLLKTTICVPILVLLAATQVPFSARAQDLAANDFSTTNSVSLVLAEARRGGDLSAHGLEHRFWQADGRTTAINVQGRACRALRFHEDRYPKGYFYFTVDPTFKTDDAMNLLVEVDYFDGFENQGGVFGLQYHAGSRLAGNTSQQFLPNVVLKGSGKWLKTNFHVADAMLDGAQNGKSDFRLWSSPPELAVSQVTVKRLPPADRPVARPALAFNSSGEAALKDWNVQWDSGARPSFTSSPTSAPPWLQIRAPGAPSGGSWRTSVRLAPGQYTFVCKARITGLSAEPQATSLSLRMSGRRDATTLSQAPDWTRLTYNLTVHSTDDIELLCEFRGTDGAAQFDLESLRLLRRSPEK